MNRSGGASQQLRSMAGNAFPSQPGANRNTPLATQRPQNGKLGSGSGWPFGMPVGGGAPGLSNPRTPLSNFAQAIGGSQSQAPLDLSMAINKNRNKYQRIDFQNDPEYSYALLGRLHSRYNRVHHTRCPSHDSTDDRSPTNSTDGQSTNNPTDEQPIHHLTATQHPTLTDAQPTHYSADQLPTSEFPSLGGPQPQQPSSVPQAWNSTAALRQAQQPPAQRPQPSQPNQQRSASGQTQNSQHLDNSTLDTQYDGQSAGTGRPTGEQPQDEFPPLGGRMDGRAAQGAINGLIGQMNGHLSSQVDRNGEPHSSDSAFGSGADVVPSPTEQYHTQSVLQDGQQTSSRQSRGPSNPPGIEHQLFASSMQQTPIGQPNAAQQAHQGTNFGTQMVEPPITSQPPQQRPLSEMTEEEKWGLPGLLAMLPGRSDNASSLTLGQDLNTLGIDFDDPEPLFPKFATPYGDARSRPVIPDFVLPAAYNVNNVPPLHSRITAFSDETLFAIFYQLTKDVMQEIAAGELYSRDWRWHKELQQWMMKDSQMAPPVRVSERSERGVYIFFDANNWRRERREFVLNYDHLDQRHGSTQPATSL